LRRVRAQQASLENAERFLVHVIDCRHDLVTRCDECSDYPTRVSSRPSAHP
jgi:MerR family gold-responsive transcriptional activator of gol and ges genes